VPFGLKNAFNRDAVNEGTLEVHYRWGLALRPWFGREPWDSKSLDIEDASGVKYRAYDPPDERTATLTERRHA
jgi:hypothetical protein